MSTIIPITLSQNLDDAARVHSISWKESHRSFCRSDFLEKHSAANQKEYIANKITKGTTFWGLFVQEKIVGVISITDSLIEDLYVLPSEQNKGYGTALLMFAVSRCKVAPTLWILDNNSRAQKLYERYGFVATGKSHFLTQSLSEIEFRLSDESFQKKASLTKRDLL